MPDRLSLEIGGKELKTSDVQGNILRGFGSLRTCHVLLRFPEDIQKARDWVRSRILASDAPLRLSTVDSQRSDSVRPLVTFSLTVHGLKRLGCRADKLAAMDSAFQRGMRAEDTRRILGDPPADEWDEDYRRPWDALLVVAFDPPERADVERRIALAIDGLPASRIEQGNVLDSNGAPIEARSPGWARFEPFGYRDSLSTTVFSEEHAQQLGIPDRPVWDPRRPLTVVLREDPLSDTGHGSYFVYRKLRQDVNGFRERVKQIAKVLEQRGTKLNQQSAAMDRQRYALFAPGKNPTPEEILTFVKARIMGRAPDGALPSGRLADNHAFNYADDRTGNVCPFSSHVRKMNPRGQTGDLTVEKERTISRRGIPYGRSDGGGDPGGDCGLLFLCAQSDIGAQFEKIQQEWANDATADFSREPVPMPDHLIGRLQPVLDTKGYGEGTDAPRYARYTETIEADYAVWDLVTFQGGEYLFAPSLSGLTALVQGSAS